MTDTPIDRLRADHIPLYEADENNECLTCGDPWPCDTIAALDALEARLEAATEHAPYGTCDWGGCNVEVARWRYSDEAGAHLPVCMEHSLEAENARLAYDGLTFRMLNEHGHIAEFTDHGYGLEHPALCRIETRLLDCPVEVAIRSLHEFPFGELGRYRVIIGESGVLEGWKLPETPQGRPGS